MKKIRAIAVMLVMTVILAQLPMLSASADTYGDFSYMVLSDGTAAITGCSGKATDVVIPSEINGYTVTSIGSSVFLNCTRMKTVTFIGTEEEWNSISIGSYNDCLTIVDIIFTPKADASGDADGNGKIDSADLLIMQNIMLGNDEFNEYADIDGNGVLDAVDLLLVQLQLLRY